MTEIQTLLAPTEVLEIQTQLTPTEILAACTGSPIHTGPYSHIFQLPRYPQSLVIKRMRLSFSIIKDERILREQMIAMQCMNDPTRSPYLVEIKGGEIIGEFVYLAFLWEPATLAEYNREKGGGMKTKKRILWELASAIQYLRSKQIIHRDIKPSNILLSNSTLSLAQVRIADFGFARILDLKESGLEFTRGIGTPAYAAPEILTHAAQYDFAVDVWSFGAVAYELLSGCKPFTAKTLHELKARQEEGPDYSKLWEESAGAREFVEGCLAVNPSQRLKIEEVVGHRFLKPYT